MVLGIVRPAIAVVQQVYKHRKAIYAVMTAQDRYISSAFKYGGYGKATSYGVRSGALAGGVIGAFINEADDSPGNGSPSRYVPKTSAPDKARSGPTRRTSNRYGFRQRSNRSKRCSCPRKY